MYLSVSLAFGLVMMIRAVKDKDVKLEQAGQAAELLKQAKGWIQQDGERRRGLVTSKGIARERYRGMFVSKVECFLEISGPSSSG